MSKHKDTDTKWTSEMQERLMELTALYTDKHGRVNWKMVMKNPRWQWDISQKAMTNKYHYLKHIKRGNSTPKRQREAYVLGMQPQQEHRVMFCPQCPHCLALFVQIMSTMGQVDEAISNGRA